MTQAAHQIPDWQDTPPEDNPLPHNLDAEKALLGAVLVNNRAYEAVEEILVPEDFSVQEHAQVFAACRTLIEKGQRADPITLKRFFENENSLTDVGGPAYLTDLAASAVTVINAREYGRIVRDTALQRDLILFGQNLASEVRAADLETTSDQLLEQAERGLTDLGARVSGDIPDQTRQLNALQTHLEARWAGTEPPGMMTGIWALDRILNGLKRQALVIIAGRPSMGKTVLALNIADRDKESDKGHAIFFSLEQSAEEINKRRIATRANVDHDILERAEMPDDETRQKIYAAQQDMRTAPITIDDTATTLAQIRSRSRRLKRKHGKLRCIVIDYLQLIDGTRTRANDGRVQEITMITRGLKLLAKELDCPVIALSQLSRQVENREPPRPQMSDLRESGSIEQDADVIILLYRPEYYLERQKPQPKPKESDQGFMDRCADHDAMLAKMRHKAECIVDKMRGGRTGTAHIAFYGARMRFADRIKDQQEELGQ
ncbi:MAG: replicative DNA helicase [Rhodospirillales bacterium]